MKKLLVTILLLGVWAPFVVQAHAPKKLTASYDAETGILTVEAPHPVKNVKSHYISEIVIAINGEETKKEYKEQSSKGAHEAKIELPGLEKGTVVSIVAKCSKMGSKKLEYTVE